jgi:hypothetical protein
MHDYRELAELHSKIEFLEHRVLELELAAEVLELSGAGVSITSSDDPVRKSELFFLWNFLVTASYPLVFGFFRKLYAFAYQSKK